MLVEYVSDGRIAVVTLNRPHADNAVTTELAAQLIEVLETIAARPSVRVAILTAAGDRAFSVGGDLYQRKQMTKEQWLRQRQVFDRVLYTLRQLRRPIFAAVHGMAYGGGCEMAISTDFIIASDDAVFGQPEAMVGLSAGGGSPVFLPRLLPPGRAMQMLMTGEPITAQEAHRLGMVNEVHPRAELMDAVLAIAGKIADNSPTAVQAVKRAVVMGQGEPVEQAIAIMMESHWRSGRPSRPRRRHQGLHRGSRADVPRPGPLDVRPAGTAAAPCGNRHTYVKTKRRFGMRTILVVLMVIGSILLAFLLAGILFANLRFFIWLAIIGLVVWGIYMLVTRPWRYS